MNTSSEHLATAADGTAAGHSDAHGNRLGPEASTSAVAEDPINILIVDDEASNLVVLETVLDDPGYRLVQAHTPDQALLALVEHEFALLILDIRLPGMSGFELAQMIKERKRTAGIPIIFLTAYYDKDQHVLEGYGTGAVDFLTKPVNPAVLRSKVSVFADLHRKNRAITLANGALSIEVLERRRAEEQLRDLNATLERRVLDRTEALRKADHKLQVMMDSITDGLLTLDTNWRVTYCNEQGARLLGTCIEALLGGRIWEVFPQLCATPFDQGFRQAVTSRQTVSFEARFPAPLEAWLRCHCYPSDEGLSVYFHDVSDRREVEIRREQLLAAEQAARAESERIARAKDDFLASLSHELRTPLAAIVGWANLLARSEVDLPTIRRGVDAIASNARAQARLVDDLLDVSRIVSGKLRFKIEPVDLNVLAAAAVEAARPSFEMKGVGIKLQTTVSQLEVMGDPVRLHQIVSNLLTNALKFTPAGGLVTVSTAGVDGQVEVTVRDTGEGIEQAFLPHLFERFSQADSSAARTHGGLGLGLSIVKNLVELHGGTVSASSAGKQQGSSFTLQFPRADAVAYQAVTTLPAQEQGDSGHAVLDSQVTLQGLSVLLVEDQVDILEIVRRILVDCGADVMTASSAEQALLCLNSGHFDVLLSDLGLPGMDGYELIESVRSKLGIGEAQLPAAAVTAFVRAEDQQRALRSGYQACILKPVNPIAMARTVFELAQGADRGAGQRRPSGDGAPVDVGSVTGRTDAAPARKLRVLFVEDNANLREHIGWMLETEEIEAVICDNGEEAEAEFAKGGFDAVMTDVSLPRMTGVELARRVLAQSPRAWVIFSTGYPMGDGLTTFGPNVRALLKPFEIEELHQLMDEVRTDLERPATQEADRVPP